ncbi:unnamed protein product [Allacma fusca]|uniref:Uncharacterized protein n=1 Tax=Allacma fusca TaxID=39272 RepID=A0A8J2LE72_9HEXA|nr:unnamed protein product [Allacma fusca]
MECNSRIHFRTIVPFAKNHLPQNVMVAFSSFSIILTLKLLLILKFSFVGSTDEEYANGVAHAETMMKTVSFLSAQATKFALKKFALKSGMAAVERESELLQMAEEKSDTSQKTSHERLEKSGPIKSVSLPPFQTLKKDLAGSTFTAVRLLNGSQSYEIDRTIPPNRPQEKAVLDEILSIFKVSSPHQAEKDLREFHKDNYQVQPYPDNYRGRMLRAEVPVATVYGADYSSKINYCRPSSAVSITYANVSPWSSQTYTMGPRMCLTDNEPGTSYTSNKWQGCRLPGFPPEGQDCCGPGCCPSFGSNGTPCQWPNCKETTESCCCSLEAGRWETRSGYPTYGFHGQREHRGQQWCPCGCYEQSTAQRYPIPANCRQQPRPTVPTTSGNGRWAKRLPSGYWAKQRPILYPTSATRPPQGKYFRSDDYQRNKTRVIYGGSYRPSFYSISDPQPFFPKSRSHPWGEVPKFNYDPGPGETQTRATTQMPASHPGMSEDWRKMSFHSQPQSYESTQNRGVLAFYSADKHVEYQSSSEALQWLVQEDERLLRSSQQQNPVHDQMVNSRGSSSNPQIQPSPTHQIRPNSTAQQPESPVILPCSEESFINEPIHTSTPLSSPVGPLSPFQEVLQLSSDEHSPKILSAPSLD